MSDDLAVWLLTQIAEDERASRLAGVIAGRDYGGPIEGIVGRHAHTWTPARVLAECDSKRRIIAGAQEADRRAASQPGHEPTTVLVVAMRLVLLAIALPYADRPGYRQEWKL